MVKDNLSIGERDALKRLANNQDIVIKKADKGGATVIMQASSYKEEALRQLSDTSFYKINYKDMTKDH